ncbi:ATP-binding protein [Enteractinococcus coprophilus]|uniref:ATPase family protein associated with various cellular activities (AAA) n=1 Tax=Enteractinococcus coprophilus TaxID=1027633 RepID=A0A543AMY5_9MICC|nr:ATP-binding protein [Enteractinococcus coprophilus]TQL73896.1 ATPase family protein associated with various cellular activities (AAA) [Enteractinococcus coprophilus]
MSGLSHDIAAMVANHAAGDEDGFYAVALDVAHRELTEGRRNAATEIRKAIEQARGETVELQTVDDDDPGVDIDSDLAEFIKVARPDANFEELTISGDLIERVRQILDEHRNAALLRDFGFTPAHRLLMEGPAGTGKTATAEVLSAELGIPLVTVYLDNLLNVYSSEEDVPSLREVFDRLARRRAIYLFDVFDTIGEDTISGMTRRVFKAFLLFVDVLGKGSIAIAATNRRGVLDRSMFRHFDTVLNFSLPTPQEAMRVLRSQLGDRAPTPVMNEVDIYEQYFEGLSQAELTLAARSAAKAAVMRNEAQVTQDDLIYALTNRGAFMLDDE